MDEPARSGDTREPSRGTGRDRRVQKADEAVARARRAVAEAEAAFGHLLEYAVGNGSGHGASGRRTAERRLAAARRRLARAEARRAHLEAAPAPWWRRLLAKRGPASGPQADPDAPDLEGSPGDSNARFPERSPGASRAPSDLGQGTGRFPEAP